MDQHIDYLKKKYSDKEFHNPYTNWSEILKRIESKYIIRSDKTQQFSNWIGNLKDKKYLRTISIFEIDEELRKLDMQTKYWIVVDKFGNPNERHEVYGCNLEVLTSMISLYTIGLRTSETTTTFYVGNCFFLLDSKLNWLTIFEVDKDKKEIKIFKSGDTTTPFDK